MPTTDGSAPSSTHSDTFARRVAVAVCIALGIGALAALLVELSQVLLLIFGAVVVSTVLHAIGDPIARRTGIPRVWALPLSALIVLGVVGGTLWFLGAQVAGQLAQAAQAAESAIPKVGHALGVPDLEAVIASEFQRLAGGDMLGRVTSLGATALGAATDLLIVLFGGVYIALTPRLYRDGFVMLLPQAARAKTSRAFDAAGRALKLWLLGQLFAMVITGVLTGLALWFIGVPAAAGLGLIAGVLEFIPLLGPFLGAAAGILAAAGMGTSALMWTIAAFLAIQQIESNVIQPIVTRRSVEIPPALLLFAVIAFGAMLGVLGVILAVPLTVVLYVLVKALYVREVLDEPTSVPGEAKPG
ncbi:AI-2E family transporter [Alsobacter sp. SYSU M60028]|uniref:AI-2E family transporter n=1 Tax=Alsobacter ponti TaxID=2962936 RepID=A0ABT1L6Q7_9HYPH|nr:AI-2E family transporter [Alsobacter ponti]MCP8937094.1 AI-2E family transporter [Alsobacter ponti]